MKDKSGIVVTLKGKARVGGVVTLRGRQEWEGGDPERKDKIGRVMTLRGKARVGGW